jgi:rare lipoprotein A
MHGIVILFATLIATDSIAAQPRRDKVLQVTVTAFCVKGTTDSGKQTRRGMVAADPNVLPIGTVVRVSGLRGRYNGTYTVADTGRAVKGNDLDIFVPDCAAAKKFGKQVGRATIVK